MMGLNKYNDQAGRALYRVFLTAMTALLTIFMTTTLCMSAGKADGDGSFGSTAGETILKVRSQCSGSYIDLYTEWGLCRVENRTIADIYVNERSEYHGGFFYLYIYHGSECKIIPWAPAATTNKDRAYTDERIRIQFNDVGEYTIYVEPMCVEDINTYWIHDRFLYWERDAEWYVCGFDNCSYGCRLYDHGTITVSCYGNGKFMESYQMTISESQMIYPKQIDGYTIDSCAWVEFDGATGKCDPSSVNFFYYRNEPESNDEEDIDFDWGTGYEAPEPEDSYSSDYGETVQDCLPELPGFGWSAYVTNPNVAYIKPQCGPGDQYQVFRSMDGNKHLYDPKKIAFANIIFSIGDWDYVQYFYVDNCMYGFFRKGVFTPEGGRSQIPEYSLAYERCGTINRDINPHNAPDDYSGEYSSCRLYYGDTVYACMESNGWYFCRFWNGHENNYGNVYLWLPGYAVNFW